MPLVRSTRFKIYQESSSSNHLDAQNSPPPPTGPWRCRTCQPPLGLQPWRSCFTYEVRPGRGTLGWLASAMSAFASLGTEIVKPVSKALVCTVECHFRMAARKRNLFLTWDMDVSEWLERALAAHGMSPCPALGPSSLKSGTHTRPLPPSILADSPSSSMSQSSISPDFPGPESI
jgi:hypothetical protein